MYNKQSGLYIILNYSQIRNLVILRKVVQNRYSLKVTWLDQCELVKEASWTCLFTVQVQRVEKTEAQ